ncbi:MAG TPA: hypothetical protein VHI95_16465 [Acidimicrobiales bacterium]|nr:hypothetical protein [Acidimicrobiales bacterium]
MSPTSTALTSRSISHGREAAGGFATWLVVDGQWTIPADIPTGLEVPDQTAALLEFIATVPDGPGPVRDATGAFLRDAEGNIIRAKNEIVIPAVYRVDQMFRLIGRTDLSLRFTSLGQKTGKFVRVTPDDDRGAPHLVLNHCNFMYLHRPWIVGTKPAGFGYDATREAQHALQFESSTYIDVYLPRTKKIWGDHLYFGKHSGETMWSDHITVDGGVFGESGRDPMAMTAASNIVVRNSSFGACRTCIDLEPNGSTGGVTGVLVDSCQFGAHRLNFLAALSGSTVGVVEQVTVNGCSVTGGNIAVTVAGGERRANFTFTANTGDVALGNPRGAVMWFDGVQGAITVTGNRNPVQMGRTPPMRIARFPNCPGPITYEGNWPADTG